MRRDDGGVLHPLALLSSTAMALAGCFGWSFCCEVEDFLSLGVEGSDLRLRADSVEIFLFATGCVVFG